MAKVSGPEEFFEVFRDQKQPRPQPEREERAEPVREQRPAPMQVLAATAPAKTVTLKVTTLLYLAACGVLLIVLSYIVGMAQRSEPSRGALKPAGGVGQQRESDIALQQGPANPVVHGEQLPAPIDNVMTGKVLQVATYPNTEAMMKRASEWAEQIRKQPDIISSGARVQAVKEGNSIILIVGGFPSAQDPAAQKALGAATRMEYRGQKVFQRPFFRNAP